MREPKAVGVQNVYARATPDADTYTMYIAENDLPRPYTQCTLSDSVGAFRVHRVHRRLP